MRKIKIIFAINTALLLKTSCENDGGESQIGYSSNGAVPNIQKASGSDSFIDLVSITSGSNINLVFTVDKAIGDINSMDVIGFYIKGDGTVFKATIAEDITTFPTNISINQTNLFSAFSELNTISDFEIGDQLKITAELTLKDGSIQKIINNDGTDNFSSNVATSNLYKVFQTYNVSCPSSLGGTYNYITTNAKAPTGQSAIGPLTGTVTLEDQGGGVYEISDASFGGWIGLYGPGNIATGVKLTDVCNKIAYTGVDQYNEVFTFSNLVINGSQMSFHWENDYGEFGDTTLIRPDGSSWPNLNL
jgi:hypothetical protein